MLHPFPWQMSPGIIANPFAAGIGRKNSLESISSIDRDLSPEELEILQKVGFFLSLGSSTGTTASKTCSVCLGLRSLHWRQAGSPVANSILPTSSLCLLFPRLVPPSERWLFGLLQDTALTFSSVPGDGDGEGGDSVGERRNGESGESCFTPTFCP